MTDLDPHRIDPDTIADYGIRDYQMLNWRDEDGLKIPKQPDAPEANAKSSDAATWGAFDTALENAAGRDDLGLGFPCAQPGHPFLFIDVDIPDGGEWVPSYDRLGNCLVERSPSGNERVALRGDLEIPAWWTNQSDPGKNTREVKLFDDTGYVTLTGDVVEDYEAPIGEAHQIAFEAWLKDVWYEFNPDADDGAEPWIDDADDAGSNVVGGTAGGGETADRDEWLDEDGVREALDHIDPDVPYDTWRDIGFALEDFFTGTSTAKRVFKDWSRGGRKWDSEAEQQADRIIEGGGSGRGRRTIGSVIQLAKEGGWDASRAYAKAADGGATTAPSAPASMAPGASLSWDQIRQLYADDETTTSEARYQAVIRLCEEYDFAMVDETGDFYVYHEPSGVFERGGQRDVEQELQANLGRHYSQHERREVLGHIKARSYVDRDDLNAGGFDEPLLCVGNGVLNVETRELHDHDPKYRFIRSIPWDYDPDAEAPNLERFMDQITRREADKLTMYEMVGHALHPEYIEKKFMVLFGPGDNGKTVFYKFVTELLGGLQNVSGVKLQKIADNAFASSTIIGNFANIAPDIDGKRVSDLGDLKTLTGGEDPYFFEPKGKQGFEAVNTATMMFGCNEPPILPERGRAIKKRLVPIELPYEFVDDPDEDDPLTKQVRPSTELKAEIITEDEMSGFLNKALDGLDRLIETNDVSLPETLDERLEIYEQNSDPIRKFAVNYLENESGCEIGKDDVYNTYVEFCRREDVKVTSRDVFFKKLRQTTLTYSETRGPRPEREYRLKDVVLSDLGREIADDILLESVDAATGDGADASTGINDRLDPLSVKDVVKDPTGYPTVKGEIRTIEFPEPEHAPAVKATLVDRSTVIDVVSWENKDVLEHVGREAVIIENAVLDEYDGCKQLLVKDGVTEIHKAPSEDQRQIDE